MMTICTVEPSSFPVAHKISRDFKPQIVHTARIIISSAVTIHNYIQFASFITYIGVTESYYKHSSKVAEAS